MDEKILEKNSYFIFYQHHMQVMPVPQFLKQSWAFIGVAVAKEQNKKYWQDKLVTIIITS